MDFLKELFPSMKQYEDQEDDEIEDLPPVDEYQDDEDGEQLEDLPPDDDENGDDLEDLPPEDEDGDQDMEALPDEDNDDFEGENADDKEMDEISNTASEDPDRQGVIRRIGGCKLVYKRKIEDGTYEEMWIFNTNKNNMRDDLKIRNAIIADSDIPLNRQKSDDGKQSYSVTTMGNAEVLVLSGLPN